MFKWTELGLFLVLCAVLAELIEIPPLIGALLIGAMVGYAVGRQVSFWRWRSRGMLP